MTLSIFALVARASRKGMDGILAWAISIALHVKNGGIQGGYNGEGTLVYQTGIWGVSPVPRSLYL